jgi:hypothetical protein
MNILGIDPGTNKTGWCVYDTLQNAAVAAGEVDNSISLGFHVWCDVLRQMCVGYFRIEHVIIERPVGQGPTRPVMVDCGIVFGRIESACESAFPAMDCVSLTRLQVCKALSAPFHGTLHVKNDSTAWAALVALHGGKHAESRGKRKKGVLVEQPGALGVCSGHAKAALAVAVAWHLMNGGDLSPS